jgi:hypothetical protein
LYGQTFARGHAAIFEYALMSAVPTRQPLGEDTFQVAGSRRPDDSVWNDAPCSTSGRRADLREPRASWFAVFISLPAGLADWQRSENPIEIMNLPVPLVPPERPSFLALRPPADLKTGALGFVMRPC